MPREITHWYVLESATQVLSKQALSKQESAAVLDCLSTHSKLAYLGAMAHDVPYYYRLGGSPFEDVAELLHGKDGQDTFGSIREIASAIVRIAKEKQGPYWAFLLGMITHYATDIKLHPLVCYLTGDYYHPDPEERYHARARHRLFETYLDSWFRERTTAILDFRLERFRSSSLNELSDVCQLLEQTITPKVLGNSENSPGGKNLWQDGYWYIARLQQLFLSTPVALLARFLKLFSSRIFEPIEALFLFGRSRPEQLFDQAMEYRCPVSGEKRCHSVLELADAAVADTVAIYQLFEPLVNGSTADVEAVLGGIRGCSLSYGAMSAKPIDAAYYSDRGVDLPGLKISTAQVRTSTETRY